MRHGATGASLTETSQRPNVATSQTRRREDAKTSHTKASLRGGPGCTRFNTNLDLGRRNRRRSSTAATRGRVSELRMRVLVAPTRSPGPLRPWRSGSALAMQMWIRLGLDGVLWCPLIVARNSRGFSCSGGFHILPIAVSLCSSGPCGWPCDGSFVCDVFVFWCLRGCDV